MSNQISPKYQMNIIQNINDKLYELFKSYDDVEAYVCKWQIFYDDFGNANFYIQYKDNEHKKIDLKKTLHLWGIERSGFFNGREKWAKGFENQRV